MKRIIITGGSGQMGRALAADLAEDGYDIVLLSRAPSKVAGLVTTQPMQLFSMLGLLNHNSQ